MKASEILELVRAGYTRAEIDAMSADPEPAPDDPDPEPTHDDSEHEHESSVSEPVPEWAQALNSTLDELRKTIQASNIRGDDMGDEEGVDDAAENALAQYLTGKTAEPKSKGGKKIK